MKVTLTAQPIHEDGSIGFDNANPIECTGDSVAEVFDAMDGDITAYPEHTAWDLTLEIRDDLAATKRTRKGD